MIASIGIFMLIRNEEYFLGPWLKRILPYVDEIVLYDGDSTDSTHDIIEYCKEKYDPNGKIRLFKGKDPTNLKEAYTKMFDDCLHELTTDWALFLHPDMHLINPWVLNEVKLHEGIAQFCHMRSFAGEPEDIWLELLGRGKKWKNIFRLRRPDLGAHYHGHYGARKENVYFRAITGNTHESHGVRFDRYPYAIDDSGLKILHFSDVRTEERRRGRMKECLKNQGTPPEIIDDLSKEHPRVSLKEGGGFTFIPAIGEDFGEYVSMRAEFERFQGRVHAKA